MTEARKGTRVYASLTYDTLSRRQSVTCANGTSASYAFTKRGDLTNHDWSKPGGAALAHYTMSYNGVGQLLNESISDPTLEWTPDVVKATDFYEGQTGVGPRLTITSGCETLVILGLFLCLLHSMSYS